jgi:hypothetical protein
MRYWLLALLSVFLFAASPNGLVAQNYTPESPKVKAMVDLAVKYLEGGGVGAYSEFNGAGSILVGYTLLKATSNPDHPKVKAGIAAAQNMITDLTEAARSSGTVVYEISIAAVLLAEADPTKYNYELQKVADWLGSVQKSHGGFGYLAQETGDTSQVQYAMLCLWTLKNVGISIPNTIPDGVVSWLRETQDPSGGWGYQGKLGNGTLVKQDRVTKSLGTAGAGALLIAGDMLGFFKIGNRIKTEEDGIPPAFIRTDNLPKQKRTEAANQRSTIDDIVKRMVQYHTNLPGFDGGLFYYYWRYSQERYESFREVMEGKQLKNSQWYNAGVDDLSKLQSPNGAWTKASKQDHTSDEICTCFATLFLVRSTQKAIITLKEGVLGGGYGLPDDLTTVRRMGNRIVNDAEVTVEHLLSLMESDAASNVELSLLPKNLQLNSDPVLRKEQVARLARLIRGRDPNARRLAAKLLGRSEDLDQVPDLIFALSDKDPYVPMIAEEGLRLLSRKLKSGNLQASPTPEQRESAQKFWKTWYLGIRPDYFFVD